MRPAILCIHPNTELYGSDRMFLQTIVAFRERWPESQITALLPGHGPLFDELRKVIDDVRCEPLFILRRSDFSIRLLLKLPELLRRIFRARRLAKSYDLTYISTVVVLDHILASRLHRVPAIVHVHELPTGPTSLAFSALLYIANAALVHISEAVRESFVGIGRKKNVVIVNGVIPPGKHAEAVAVPPADENLFRILLIGRFNAWKGQTLLVEAISRIPADTRHHIKVRLVGGVYGDQTHFRDEIMAAIGNNGLAGTIEVHDFTPSPALHYEWANVVTVPSTQPEPFGLVAIEAMASHRAVIAADHGGVADVVEDGVTGNLFEPGNAEALASAILARFKEPAETANMGEAGAQRFSAKYTAEIYRRRIADTATELVQGGVK